jgi:hypothetical protein
MPRRGIPVDCLSSTHHAVAMPALEVWPHIAHDEREA